jgi:hypothetical protein
MFAASFVPRNEHPPREESARFLSRRAIAPRPIAETYGSESKLLSVTLGRVLIFFGLAAVAIGVLVEFAPALRIGRLPGDFSFGGHSWRVYVPLGTSILLSILLTLVLALVGYFSARR